MFNHFNTSREHSAECYPETKCTHHDGVASAKNLPDSRAGAARPKIENRRRIKRQNSQTPTRALTEFRNAPGDAGIKLNDGAHCLDRPADNTTKYCLADDNVDNDEYQPKDTTRDHSEVFREQT
jgi:hypothetical protein